MSERPTPETERVKGALHTNWDDLLNHARRLERERDKARKELDEIRAERDLARLSSMESDQAHDRMVGELEKVYQELDEAREKAERYRLEANAMMLQRDEAREERDLARKEINHYREKNDLLPISWDV